MELLWWLECEVLNTRYSILKQVCFVNLMASACQSMITSTGLPKNSWSHLASYPGSSPCRKTGREPGRFDHMPHGVLCVVLIIKLPYSLDITPPSFISPSLLLAWICCWGILFISNLHPSRPLWLRWTTGRLDLTVPPYIWSLATYWPAIHQPSDWLHGGRLVSSWWWCENCIAFSDRSHSAPSLIIS